MKKITINELKSTTGLIELASAAEYINDGIYGYLLETEEEQASACPNNTNISICNTCNIHNDGGCNHYEYFKNGIKCHI